jgi:hypothetical protein
VTGAARAEPQLEERRFPASKGWRAVDALRNRGGIGNGSRHVTHLDLKLRMDLENAVRLARR